MTDEEKKILITLLNKSIASAERMKFDYLGKAKSFAEAMHLNQVRNNADDELNELLQIDKNFLKEKIEKRLKLLHSALSKIKHL